MANISAISPLAPKGGFPDLPEIRGVRFSALSANIKYIGRPDLMLAALDKGSVIAGAFTRSATRSAPVLWCQDNLAKSDADKTLAIIVNSGNANAFTGQLGTICVQETANSVAKALNTAAHNVFIASTGVIGEPLAAEKITAKMDDLVAGLRADGAPDAARAIMTTDTYAKGATVTVDLDGVPVKIAGFAKGSGMIAPDMATMLAFIFTDANIDKQVLQDMVSANTQTTFNAITVDSDTSTSDSLIVGATGQADMTPITTNNDPRVARFSAALHGIMHNLAHQVVRDGEGATKFVEITVTGAKTDHAAKTVGLAIANSPLVKTAFAGEDPNWGRIVAAIGKAGEEADRDQLAIRFGDILVAENGYVSPEYREEDGAAYMKAQDLAVSVGLGVGDGKATVWTCDLTHQYIAINADYRS